ncbi:MAG TPA: WYL domain-containing protein, partial [Alphaproteobacteria bacterium]|nr:WYL domain-containing protein [Alphaproteobacteria bacterium]
RAWRSDRGRFGDVVLDRIEAIHETKKARHSAKDDAEWQTEIEVRLGPHPGLDPEARRHIEWQYNMRSGRTTVKVRRAMLLYFLKRYQIEEESTRKAPHQQPLFILNRDEVTAALPPWKRVPPEAG